MFLKLSASSSIHTRPTLTVKCALNHWHPQSFRAQYFSSKHTSHLTDPAVHPPTMSTPSRLGIACLAGRGHLYPAIAFGRGLRRRGHDVTILSRKICAQIVSDSGLGFWPIDQGRGSGVAPELPQMPQRGRYTMDVLYHHTQCVLSNMRTAIRATGIKALIVDQADLASGTVAECLGIPFVSIAFHPPVYLSDDVPPIGCGSVPRSGPGPLRPYRRANALFRSYFAPILALVNRERDAAHLAKVGDVNQLFSSRAIITQLPAALEFPRAIPPHLHYTGALTDERSRRSVVFPWQRLDGRPLIYACMGTVRNMRDSTFVTIAEACNNRDAQLVLSLGGTGINLAHSRGLPGRPIVVPYAPQIELLRRASLAIIHAGLNTTLECVACGIPMVAIPITDDQPGVAARVKWRGLGTVLPFRQLDLQRLRRCVDQVLLDPQYALAAKKCQGEIGAIDGVERAADILEHALSQAS
jgi:zeaxanthin glucosyltransferase